MLFGLILQLLVLTTKPGTEIRQTKKSSFREQSPRANPRQKPGRFPGFSSSRFQPLKPQFLNYRWIKPKLNLRGLIHYKKPSQTQPQFQSYRLHQRFIKSQFSSKTPLMEVEELQEGKKLRRKIIPQIIPSIPATLD